MGLKIVLPSTKAFVTCVSSLFVTKNNPNGLTPREIELVTHIINHSVQGVIITSVRKNVQESMGINKRTFYNMAYNLKLKRAIDKDQLHKVFITDKIELSNAKRDS